MLALRNSSCELKQLKYFMKLYQNCFWPIKTSRHSEDEAVRSEQEPADEAYGKW